MKKLILSLTLLIGLSSYAQIEIRMGLDPMDVSGTTINFVLDPALINDQGGDTYWENHFILTNNTGTDRSLRIKRVKTNVPAGWVDLICWPPDCFTTSGDVFLTPNDICGSQAPIVQNGTSNCKMLIHDPVDDYPCDVFIEQPDALAEILPKITPLFNASSSATYTYYVVDAATGENLDSLILNFSYTASVQEKKASSAISISPNPADEFVSINLEGAESATIKMVDVLGNEVLSKYVTGTMKVNTSDFRSGVYFVTINSDAKKTITKKLVIRH